MNESPHVFQRHGVRRTGRGHFEDPTMFTAKPRRFSQRIDDAEDREKFKDILNQLGLKQPANGIARNMAQGRR